MDAIQVGKIRHHFLMFILCYGAFRFIGLSAVVVLGLVSPQVQLLAGKNVSEMIYFWCRVGLKTTTQSSHDCNLIYSQPYRSVRPATLHRFVVPIILFCFKITFH